MKSIIFLLLRLICYLTLAILLVAGAALAIVWVNGQCSAPIDMAVTCASKFSQRLADLGLAVWVVSLDAGVPIVLASGGLIYVLRDVRRWLRR